jgi:hypothetical protein
MLMPGWDACHGGPAEYSVTGVAIRVVFDGTGVWSGRDERRPHDATAGYDVEHISRRPHSGLIYAPRVGAPKRRGGDRTQERLRRRLLCQNVLMLEALSAVLAQEAFAFSGFDGFRERCGVSYGRAVVAASQRRGDVPGDSRASP